MSDLNKQLLKEQNAQELVVAAKIISSILIGLLCGLIAYFAFNRTVFALVAAPLAGGLLIGVFFAHKEHRITIASILVVCVVGAIILAVMIRIESETYASFFGYVRGLACIVAVIALIPIVGFFAQTSNTNEASSNEGSGAVLVCVGAFVLSIAVSLVSGSISNSLRPQPVEVAETTPAAEQDAQKKFLNSPEMRAIAKERREEEQNEREFQKQKMSAERERDEQRSAQVLEMAKEKREAYYKSRAFALSFALKTEPGISEYVRVVIYFDRRAIFTVEDSWHLLPYQIRLQAAQNLNALWRKFADTDDAAGQMFDIVDLNGNRVGGRGVFGDWVQKD